MFRLGKNLPFDLAESGATSTTVVEQPALSPIVDVAAAVRASLANPKGFPPLDRAVVPGDHVTIALAPRTPQAVDLVRGVVAALVAAGVSASDIRLIAATEEGATFGVSSVAAVAAELDIAFELHDPQQSESLTYLAASHDAQPIYLNRALVDADFVIPIGPIRRSAAGYLGAAAIIYPLFSDLAAQSRARQTLAKRGRSSVAKIQREQNDVAWLLGAQFAVQVVAGPANSALGIVAGALSAASAEAAARHAAIWEFPVRSRFEFIVALLDEDASDQSWTAVAEALENLDAVATPDATIVICTELSSPPGPTLKRLASGGDRDQALRQAAKERLPDLAIAASIQAATERYRIYMMSRLEAELVEELGMGAIAEPEQIARLAKAHSACLAVKNASFAMPSLARTEATPMQRKA